MPNSSPGLAPPHAVAARHTTPRRNSKDFFIRRLYNLQRVGTLNVVVLYDRWEEEEDDSAATDKAPLTRTLDKKEVEDEVAEALGKLGHQATLHCLDGSTKSLHALARM